jgi:hypothetical protein
MIAVISEYFPDKPQYGYLYPSIPFITIIIDSHQSGLWPIGGLNKQPWLASVNPNGNGYNNR